MCAYRHVFVYIFISIKALAFYSSVEVSLVPCFISEWSHWLCFPESVCWQAEVASKLEQPVLPGKSWVIMRDRWAFWANVNMLWALGKSDWQLLNEYWGKHCPFLTFSSLARDGDVGYINRSPGRQVHYVSTFQPSLQQLRGMWQTCCLIYICFCWSAVNWAESLQSEY